MPDPAVLAGPTQATNQRTLELIEHHDPERAARMRALTSTGVPPHAGQPELLAAWNAEVLEFLAETVRDLARAEKNRQRAADRERKWAERARKKVEKAGSDG
jgi:hypothetical protein